MIYLPLDPETKRPAVRGWAKDGYQGVERGDYTALRTDGLLVVDCDSMDAAGAWYEEPGTETPYMVRTGRGMHFYYQAAEGVRSGPMIRGSIDIKTGKGAYVLPAGALHPSGARYTRVVTVKHGVFTERDSHEPVAADLPPAPVALIEKYRPKHEEGNPLSGWETVPEGARNTVLTALGGALRRQGAGPGAIAATLATFNHNRCDPPLADEEVITIVGSVCRYKMDPFENDGDLEIE